MNAALLDRLLAKPDAILARLASNSHATPSPDHVEGDCTVWDGPTDHGGYGKLNVWPRGTVTIHRAAWIVQHGPIPEGMFVLHDCDTPLCWRHLRLGTAKHNAEDRVARGRMRVRA